MGFKVNTNMDALSAYYALSKVNAQTTKAQLRLATGKKINHVWDDTSGFNVGNQMATKAKILQAVQGNISSGKDVLSTAESALLNIKDIVINIKTKISDATNPVADREALAKDIASLGEEIASIFKTTKFNETTLLAGTMAAAASGYAKFEFQVTDSAADKLTLDFASGLASTGSSSVTNSSGTASNYFISSDIATVLSSIMGAAGAGTPRANDAAYSTAIASLGSSSVGSYTFGGQSVSAVDKVSKEIDLALQKIGNFAQRLDAKNEFLNVAIANAESSVSRLFDADYALEQLNATKGSIMQQASMAMMAQLSFAPQSILSLFG